MMPGDERWLTAGDPTFLGWFTTVAYLVGALLALRAWRAHQPPRAPCAAIDDGDRARLATWWLGVSVLMIVIGLNKELDLLQKLVRVWGKAAALSEGWYADRAMVQRAFIALLLVLLAGAGLVTLRYIRNFWTRISYALLGVAMILAYAFLRAAVFNGMRNAVPVQVSALLWLLEPLGILLVIWCAVLAAKPGARP